MGDWGTTLRRRRSPYVCAAMPETTLVTMAAVRRAAEADLVSRKLFGAGADDLHSAFSRFGFFLFLRRPHSEKGKGERTLSTLSSAGSRSASPARRPFSGSSPNDVAVEEDTVLCMPPRMLHGASMEMLLRVRIDEVGAVATNRSAIEFQTKK
uniref:Uncharacterized protein n=1 Tax=Oryza punctata TaxID=4537 RepID=A0A0E0LTY3_ORYPU